MEELTKKENIKLGWFGTIFSQVSLLLLALYIFYFESKQLSPMGWIIVGILITTIFLDWKDHNERKKRLSFN